MPCRASRIRPICSKRPGVLRSRAVSDPLKPDSWHNEPGVCGSCIAWRPTPLKEGDEVATGACRLRPELGRVPATLKLCDLYKPRGQFVYAPTPEKPSRKRRAQAAKVLRRSAEGEMVPDQAASPPPPSEPAVRPPPPRTVDAGTDDADVLRRVLVELLANEVSTVRRDMHPRFERGRVTVVGADGQTAVEVTAERFFELLDRMKLCLEELEEAVVRYDALLPVSPELVGNIRRMQGSMTTFNFLFADRGDYFSGKY